MADLRLSEAAVLMRFLEDHDGRIALKSFFHQMAAENSGKALSYLTSYDDKSAMEYAFYANAFNQAFSDLEKFCAAQLSRAQQ